MARNVKIIKEKKAGLKKKINFELSAGALIFRREKGKLFWLLLHYPSGHWDFPKGHQEGKEQLIDTVKREVAEETGITRIKVYPGFKKSIQYFFNPSKYQKEKSAIPQLTLKKVFFYLGETDQQELKISPEHLAGEWLETKEALKRLTFKEAKNLLKEAVDYLKEKL